VTRLGARTRRLIAIALIAAGCVCLLVGEVALYADRNLADADRFADRAVSSLDDEATRDEIGALVATKLERKVDPDLVAFRAIVETVVSGLTRTEPFQAALRAAVVQAHRIALGEGEDTAVVTLANFGVAASEALEAVSPKAAKEIPGDFRAKLISFAEGGAATDLAQLDLGPVAVVALLLALLLLVAGILASNERRAGITGAAAGIALVGLLAVVGYEIGEALAARAARGSGAEAAVRSLWSALLGDLRDLNVALCFAAAVVAGASASLLRPVDTGERLRALVANLEREPRTTPGKVARGLALVAVGVFVLASPDAALHLLVVAVGLALAFVGTSELLTLIAGPAPERDARPRVPFAGRAAILAGVGALALTGIAVAALNDDTGVPEADSGCNGSPKLCERTIDTLTFPATHNSMAAAENPGWLFPMHDRTIPEQLDDGIRALLIDAYYGFPGRRVYTDFERGPNKLRADLEKQLGPDFVAAADRIRSTVTEPTGESKLYLCHGFCELGAIDLVDTLRQVDAFLDQNPNEVVMIDIEDYVAPEDIVGAFEESGLAEHAYDGPLGPDFPTLQELIDSDERAIVLAENHAGGAPWYRLAYDYFQETGYDFKRPEQMDCSPNRGGASNPLFLINNWINTDPAARPSNAGKVNAHDFLLARAERCARQRGLVPNVIAVDFYRQGDLLEVADELNRRDG
jgi:hypothetical protein